jgi:hypothetical protein
VRPPKPPWVTPPVGRPPHSARGPPS